MSHDLSSSQDIFSPSPTAQILPNTDNPVLLAPGEIFEATETALRIAIEQKGLDPRGLDLRGITDITDYFVIVSGTSDRHVKGIAEKIKDGLAMLGHRPLGQKGSPEACDWILLDYGDLVVHVFYEPIRQYYEFDSLWKQGHVLALDPELESQSRKLRTGMIR